MDDTLKNEIEQTMNEIILDLCPDVALVPKYGGIMIEVTAGDPRSQVGGYFFYKSHMSMEFSYGAVLHDPKNILEGRGKYRRHIKIRDVDDFENKKCRALLEQAVQTALLQTNNK